jgi:hypothetical protein
MTASVNGGAVNAIDVRSAASDVDVYTGVRADGAFAPLTNDDATGYIAWYMDLLGLDYEDAGAEA